VAQTSDNAGSPAFRVAADIGGTFTDLAYFGADGTIATWKVPSTPDDYGRAVVDGLCALLDKVGVPYAAASEVLHGCTVATNAILENRGARTALITTRGFRDVLEFRRIRVPRLYDPLYVKPAPLVPRELRLEVRERLAADGSVVTPLDEAEVLAAIEVLRREKVEAVAVCFLHSYVNPAHERRVGELVRAHLPGVFVTLSVDILPEMREYERTSTAVINSYVGPPVATYIASLADRLRAAKFGARLLVMQSSGGILGVDMVRRVPARIVECGPAAGVIGAAHQAARSGYPNVITLDMGGTTAKASMIEGGRIVRTDEYEVGGGISLSSRLVKGGGYALRLPVIDISEVGAGGGSIVWFDKADALKVGPRSAGAVPGPACYGQGGADATVTDANVVLGFINPVALAGGTVPIDARLSERAIATRVADRLGVSLRDAAWAVHVVASANMMRAVKAVSTYRGRDPRDCVLMAFGGNGGIFAVELARQLQMRRVLVPPAAGVFSALGLGVAPVEFSRSQAHLAPVGKVDPAALARAFVELEASVVDALGYGRERLDLRRAAAMRYAGQAFELSVPLPDPLGATALADAAAAFEAEHERTYGHRLHDGGVELVAIEATATLKDDGRGATPLAARPRPRAGAAGMREAYFGPEVGAIATPVVDRADLDHEPRPGPLIIEEYEGTSVVPPGATASLDKAGNIVIEIVT
jgi:N-methylhydantoinase A